MRATFVTLLAVAAGAALPASAATITFDDLTAGDNVFIQNGYAGLNWDNVGVLRAADRPQSGYANAVVSGPNVAFNGYGQTATISGTGFTLTSGYFGSGFDDAMTVNVTGYVGGVATYSSSFLVTTLTSLMQTFNWTNLSSVAFTPTGGVHHVGYGGVGPALAIDNLSVTVASPVPEPATWAMMILGFGFVGVTLRGGRHYGKRWAGARRPIPRHMALRRGRIGRLPA